MLLEEASIFIVHIILTTCSFNISCMIYFECENIELKYLMLFPTRQNGINIDEVNIDQNSIEFVVRSGFRKFHQFVWFICVWFVYFENLSGGCNILAIIWDIESATDCHHCQSVTDISRHRLLSTSFITRAIPTKSWHARCSRKSFIHKVPLKCFRKL